MNSRNKTIQRRTGRSALTTFLSRVSLILCLQITLVGVAWGQTPAARFSSASLDFGRSDPNRNRRQPRHRNQQT